MCLTDVTRPMFVCTVGLSAIAKSTISATLFVSSTSMKKGYSRALHQSKAIVVCQTTNFWSYMYKLTLVGYLLHRIITFGIVRRGHAARQIK